MRRPLFHFGDGAGLVGTFTRARAGERELRTLGRGVWNSVVRDRVPS